MYTLHESGFGCSSVNFLSSKFDIKSKPRFVEKFLFPSGFSFISSTRLKKNALLALHQWRCDVAFVLSVEFPVFTRFRGSVVVAFVPSAMCDVRHDLCEFSESAHGRDGGVSSCVGVWPDYSQ